jgi:site-specific recombinase XerD
MIKRKVLLSQVVEGFLLDAEARSLSPRTVADYSNSFRKLRAFLGDPPFAEITAEDVRRFMADLGTPRAPAGVAVRPARAIGKKQKLNIHTGLSALWTWAVRAGLADEHVIREIQRPRPERPAIQPFSEKDIRALLAACDRRSIVYARPGKRACDNERGLAVRDRAIVLLLLDTGMRASELAGMRLHQVDIKNKQVRVFGKGSKERIVPLGARTAAALWRYVSESRREARANEPVFLGLRGEPLTRNTLLKLIYRLGAAAGVTDAHPHRFRHTYAIQYLRNGGNERTLQETLGHESLDMLRTYTRIALADVVNGHQVASPVENWRL